MSQQSSESGRAEQIINQLQLKALHAVLGARVPALHHGVGAGGRPPDAARVRKRDRWFNLALGEPPPALDHLALHHAGVMDPLFVDIILCPRDSAAAYPSESVIERWCVQCEPPAPQPGLPWSAAATQSPGRASDSASVWRTYKKSIVLLRSLYSVLRLLPAYRVFRLLAASHQPYNYDISYKISSFATPFSREEEQDFHLHTFTPVETQFGQLSVSVTYRPSLSEFSLEVSSVLPPTIINNYVGSPAADPMRSFPSSLEEKGAHAISFPLRAAHMPASSPSFRPHSWTSAPSAHHPRSTSPFSDARMSPPDAYGHRILSQRSSTQRKSSSFRFDEYRLSPPFLQSPTPSPPTYSSNSLQSRLRSETAPVSIPQPVTGKSQFHRAPNLSDPTKTHLPPPSPRSVRADLLSQGSPSEGRSFRKLEGLRGLKDGKDDSGRFSGVLSSCGSPGFGFSRSSSRLSMQDDFDDGDFSCPFAVDDMDASDSYARNFDGKDAPESAQGSASSRKSQDAAVGMLVHMLKTAAPLRQDQSCSCQSSKSELHAEAGSSSFFVSHKASDALEELQRYREMKDKLLSQSGTQL